jgi:hypothetical protein
MRQPIANLAIKSLLKAFYPRGIYFLREAAFLSCQYNPGFAIGQILILAPRPTIGTLNVQLLTNSVKTTPEYYSGMSY